MNRKISPSQLYTCVLVGAVILLTLLAARQGSQRTLQTSLERNESYRPPKLQPSLATPPRPEPQIPEEVYDTEAEAPPPTVAGKPVMILQHDCQCYDEHITELARHSVAQHARYAAAHGYSHRVSTGQYVPRENWSGTQYMNKVHLALQVILEELEKGDEGVQWIQLTDADTLITDPSIPLHLLLPDPSLLTPTPMVIGNRDVLGFNAGVITYHVSHRTATFLARVLTVEYHTVEPDSSVHSRSLVALWPPSDQYSIALALQNYRDAGEAFYEVPQGWWNSYDDPMAQPAGDEADFETASASDVRLRIHLAGPSKWERNWAEWLRLEEEVWVEAARLARDNGVEGTGIELMPNREKASKVGEEWWKDPRNGIDDMVFNGI